MGCCCCCPVPAAALSPLLATWADEVPQLGLLYPFPSSFRAPKAMQADDFLLVGVGCTHTMHHTHNHPPLKKLLCRRPPPSIRAQKAKQAGDFLLVGVHTDEDVTERRGPHLPIMGLHERALSVLSCRYVDEVVIGEPLGLSPVHFACREGRCCEDVHPTNCSAHSGSIHAIALTLTSCSRCHSASPAPCPLPGAPMVITEDLLTTFNISLVRFTSEMTSKKQL